MPLPQALHEDFQGDTAVSAGSDRAFGFVFFVVFVIVGLWPVVAGGPLRLWSLGVAAAVLAIALIRPTWLSPVNRLWFRFGLLLHAIVTPVIMGILFFLIATPTGIIMRLAGKAPVRAPFDPGAKTYWIERKPPGPAPDGMRNQF